VLDDGPAHDGHGAPAAQIGPCVAGDDLDGARVRAEAGGLAVGAVALRVAVAVVEDHVLGRGGVGRVGPVHQHGAFVHVGVAGKHEVHAAGLEDRHDIMAHLREVLLAVGVVAALGVGRVVPEGDEPVGPGLVEIGPEPLGHRRGGLAVEIVGIEADEVYVAVVEGIVGLGAGGDAARFAAGRDRVGVVVGPDAGGAARGVPLVVAHRGPADRMAERGVVGLEEAALELVVPAVVVGHVADMQPEIQRTSIAADLVDHGPMHGRLRLAAGPPVADDPEAIGPSRADRRRRRETAGAVRRREPTVTVEHGVVVGGVGPQVGKPRLVLERAHRRAVQFGEGEIRRGTQGLPLRRHRLAVGAERGANDDRRALRLAVERIRRDAEADDRVDRSFRAPEHVHEAGARELEVRRTGEGFGRVGHADMGGEPQQGEGAERNP
jgi:hypothetical protein